MFEHPYLSRQVSEFEREQMERMAERRRFIAEHPERLIPKPEGAVRRALRRMRSVAAAGFRRSGPSRSGDAAGGARRIPAACDPAPAR